MKKKRESNVAALLRHSMVVLFILIVLTLLIGIWLGFLQSSYIIFGTFYLLFLPGFIWSWIFWSKSEIKTIERIILSLVLSIAITPLVLFIFMKFGAEFNTLNAFLEILLFIVLGGCILVRMFKKTKNNLL
jgi:uncharacterized membrane protein